MTTTYRLHVSELSVEVINSIKAAFKDKIVEIVVSNSETIRKHTADEDSFNFWVAEEENLYQDYLEKKLQ